EIKELTLVYTDSGQITLPAGQQGQITFDPWLGLVGTYLVTVDVTVADDYDLTDNHMETIITLTDNIPPEITNVQAIPQSQTNAPPNFVNITAEVTDNVQVALVEAIITYPDSSVHTFPMNEAKGIYYLNQEYTDVGTYYFDIHAVDIYNNENTATGYWFEITENNPPDAPTNPYPANGATGVPVTTVMSVDVSDPDNEPLTVYFYWANNTLIGTASNVPSGGTATIGPITLNELTTYEWYAVAFDGMYSTPSPTWSFTTGMAMPPYIEIGNPASTTCTGYVPTYGFWDYSWSAVIYLQSEIGYEFDIVKIAYDVCNNPAMYTFQNQKIYMGHTTLSSWPDSTQPDNSTLTLVYEGPITFNGPGWHEIELQTPFHYNNVDNLVIYWENQDGSWASGYPTFRYTSQTNRSKYDYADYTWPPPAPGYVGAYMANIRLYRQINYDVGVKSINYPLNGSAIGETTPVFVNATVKNYGAQPATFNVNCTITKIVKEEKPLWVYEDFTATWTDQNGDGFTEPPGWINDVYNTGPSTYYYPYWHQNTAYYHTSPAAAFVWWDYEDQDEYLITPQIDLTTATNPKLEFYSYVYRGSTYGDHYWVDISTDDGQTWTHLLDFSSLSGGWDYWGTLYQIDLSAYTGQVVRIAFHAYASGGIYYAWGIDDVRVYEPAMEIVYYEEKPMTLNPGEEMYVEFGPWIAQPAGIYEIKVKTLLMGDEVPGNDEKTIQITVVGLKDVGTESINYPVEGGVYPQGNMVVEATVKNYGTVPAKAENTYITVGIDSRELKEALPSKPGATEERSFVVNLTVYKKPGAIIYYEDFEASNGGFVGDGSWQWGIPTSGPNASHSGTKLWATNLAGNYPNYANDRLTSPAIALPAGHNYYLAFWHWYNIEAGYSIYDGGNVKISTDGSTWQILGSYLNPYPYASAYSGNAGIPGEPCFSGASNGWVFTVMNLSAYAGQTIYLRWHFGSDSIVNYAGWYVDDIAIYQDAAPGEIVFYNEQTVPTLQPGEEYDVSFAPWFAMPGEYLVEVKTKLAGDMNPSNDVKTVNITIQLTQIDVGVKSINYPANGQTFYANDDVYTGATLKNYGVMPANFVASCTIIPAPKQITLLEEDFTATWTDQNGDGFTEPPGWINDVYNTGPSTYYYPYWHQNT
ncbi:MAG: choice-of-anchor J domain-containing protein, partial [Candidatus Thermoplasmatota archaeon]